MNLKNLFIVSIAGFVFFVVIVGRLGERCDPSQGHNVGVKSQEISQITVPELYRAAATIRSNLIANYRVNQDEVVAAYITLRDMTLPSVGEFWNALARLELHAPDRDRHAMLMADASALRNALVNLKNAYVTDHVARDISKLDQYIQAVDQAIQNSNKLWAVGW